MSNKRARYDVSGSSKRRKRGPGAPGARGSGHRPLPVLRAPRISLLETQLDRLGVAVQRFRQFRSGERMNVQPASGHCRWYCVPHTMDYGMPMPHGIVYDATHFAEEQKVLKQTPNSGDLYDIYRNLTAGLGPGGAYAADTRQAPYLYGLNAVGGAAGIAGVPGQQDVTGTPALWAQIPSAFRIEKPGMDYTQRTSITYDNVSSLDAFVEVYELDYEALPNSQVYGASTLYLGNDLPLSESVPYNQLPNRDLLWAGTSAGHPGVDYCPAGIVPTQYPNPIFGGSLLKYYADCVLYQRTPIAVLAAPVVATTANNTELGGAFGTIDLGPAVEGVALNSAGRGAINNQEERDQVVCHPRVDPTRCTPPRRPTSKIGITLKRVREAQRIRPGQSSRFDVPALGTRHWSYADSPQGRKNQTEGIPFNLTTVTRAKVYCFRVWGDMIHNKLEPGNTGAETDFQTGSTSVTFHQQRVIWARVRNQYLTQVNPQLLPFDAVVDLINQEQINEETGRPEVIMQVGDNVINP